MTKEEAKRINICKWKENIDGYYDTDCSNSFVLIDDTPSKNGMNFCCYCGCSLQEELYKGDDNDEG